MSLVSKFKKSSWKGCRMVLPEGGDPRVLEAAVKAKKLKLADPFFVGNRKEIEKSAKKLGVSLRGFSITDTSRGIPEKYLSAYRKVRKAPAKLAGRILSNPLFLASLMVRMGEADAMVAGAVSSSADVITAATGIIGLRKGVSVPSSFFIMEIPNNPKVGEKGLLLFADSSVNIELTAGQMADVAITTAHTAKELMGWTPRAAMLSFSTKGSSIHPRADKVIEAARIANRKAPGLYIDGEMQGDSALVPSTARKKIKGKLGPVAGRANILIFPDLDSGNISYKLTQCLGGANAYGPILQGFRKPVSDLSRGAKTGDIVGSIAILSTWAKRVKK